MVLTVHTLLIRAPLPDRVLYKYMDQGDYINQESVNAKPRKFYFLGLAFFVLASALLSIAAFVTLAL